MITTALAALLACAGCEAGPSEADYARRDRLRAERTDPAIADALASPILADRTLRSQDESLHVRATPGPVRVTYPPAEPGRVGAHRGLSGRGPAGEPRCDDRFARGPEWARRLPPEFPLFPGARLIEAAGNDAGPCRVRAVTFRTSAPWRAVIDFYEARAAQAGFTHERQQRDGEHILGGAREGDDGAYYLIATPRPDGTEVALIVNRGR